MTSCSKHIYISSDTHIFIIIDKLRITASDFQEMFVKILSFHLHVYLILTFEFLKSILPDPGPNVFLLKNADEKSPNITSGRRCRAGYFKGQDQRSRS